ncbi:ankyrin repeat domain-containing protein [Micromonospora lutea]|nr:ankyrin repeat domain-containing protein [Micromonospora lutea]
MGDNGSSGRDAAGWAALDRAAAAGDIDQVTALLGRGEDPLATGPDGRSPYQIALAAGHLEVATVLRAAEDAASGDPVDRGWRPYCRGYLLGALRRFPAWREETDGDPLGDDAVVYLHDDLSVTVTPWPGDGVLFDGTADGWAAFCTGQLGFAVPDDLALAAAAKAAEGPADG